MLLDYAKSITRCLPKWIQFFIFIKSELVIYIYPNYLEPFFQYLKQDINSQFKMLIDITAVDYPSRSYRFEIIYNLLTIHYNSRIRVKSCLDETSSVNSITTQYPAAGWWEREVWDMFGIFFSNHVDLRRILTDYGFEGHPLRKDFPLTGYVEVRFDDSEKRVRTESLELTQELRFFDFSTPWESFQKIV